MITMNGYDGKDVELLMDVDGVAKKHTHTLLTGFYTGVRTTVLGDISFLLFLAETIERTTISIANFDNSILTIFTMVMVIMTTDLPNSLLKDGDTVPGQRLRGRSLL